MFTGTNDCLDLDIISRISVLIARIRITPLLLLTSTRIMSTSTDNFRYLYEMVKTLLNKCDKCDKNKVPETFINKPLR